MSAEQLKERLHLRIEQADEKLLGVLADMAERLFEAYQPLALDQTDVRQQQADYSRHLRPLSREAMTEEIGKAMEDYENGRFITLDESSKEAGSW
ncbi:hypothetical protein [Phaeodactylibacter sp.]|uniref:hypothetical protein n=1 Tax=Phaeodactylibacter sp. TaxID=1940289 RepID=UPI0025ED4692|nr:hypothetical protein [Phaeodactylibacter sp.]MCI4646660.1 hypothetical protein [Phaeodactylibacter sp.]MCI5093711.1 hypothetical protein [Phaeodactylibacter sp.]